MTLVGEIKLESLIAGQHSLSRGNGSDHMNDKQAFTRLWQLSPRDCDEHSSTWQAIHNPDTNMFIVQSDTPTQQEHVSLSQLDVLIP